jgi:hypothetical protein
MSKDIRNCKGGTDCHEENNLSRIVIRKEFDRVKEIVRDAKYYCKKCGRAAHSEGNLCRPARI